MTEPLAGYEPLAEVLSRALEQAQSGKGDERHANGLPFLEQPIMVEQRQQKGTGFVIGQARKKSLESMGLEVEPAVRELLGAINYLAAAVIYLEEGPGCEEALPYSIEQAKRDYLDLFTKPLARPFPAG